MGHGPAIDRRCGVGSVSLSCGHLFFLQPIHHSAQSGIFSRPSALRSRTLSPGAKGQAPALCLFSLRRWQPAVYRGGFRLDGRGADGRHHRPAMAAAVRSRTNRRGTTQNNAPPQVPDDVCSRAALGDMHLRECRGAQQVPPLRYAPVGMTILLEYEISPQTNLSSRPERSVVEGPAVRLLPLANLFSLELLTKKHPHSLLVS